METQFESKRYLLVSILLIFTLLIFNYHADFFAAQIDKNTKWIVITTINYPTQAIKQLSQQGGWHVVVVADKKTPAGWSLSNCDFLSIEDQKGLNYHITKLLPWNHYCRKNIGYLYAIEHGASIIYDTDDDNNVTADSITYLPEKAKICVYQTEAPTVNPYAHFGQPTIWPRGYPLEDIMTENQYEIVEQEVKPLIQQCVVDGDPDVDAIFRLTRKLDIYFDKTVQPIGLPKNTLCPFNSQSTLFHYDAFWGLLIPMTTKFRVCDIWRGLWVQRVLSNIGGTLCFLPPNAQQDRNEHNLLADFIDEIDLYTKSGRLVQFLRSFKSKKTNLPDYILELTNAMIEQGYYFEQERELVKAWLEDLKRVGYQFPPFVSGARAE